MEYFAYLQIPEYIIQIFRQYMSGGAAAGISPDELYILLGVAGGAYLICLILGGLALFVMAERAGHKHSWLGFIPFANTYYAAKVAGETNFFGKKMKRAGLYAMLAEIVYVALQVCSLVSSIVISNPSYYETNSSEGSSSLILNLQSVPAGFRWMVSGYTWFSSLALIANLIMLVLFCAVYMGLYRKYSPRRSFALTVVSVLFPIRAFVLFAVRNNRPVDYGEYMQERLEQAMRSAGIEIGSDGNAAGNPFADFSGSPSSPFAEFDDTPPADPPVEPNDDSEYTDHDEQS